MNDFAKQKIAFMVGLVAVLFAVTPLGKERSGTDSLSEAKRTVDKKCVPDAVFHSCGSPRFSDAVFHSEGGVPGTCGTK